MSFLFFRRHATSKHVTCRATRHVVAGALMLALIAALAASARAQTWVQTSGPFDPSYGCRDMAFAKTSPQVGYLCVDDTLYSTTDCGLTWHIAMSMGSIYDGHVAIDEGNANLVYAAGSSLRVSTDGGASWSTRTLPPYELRCIIARGGKLWAGTVGGSGGLYRSVDTARTWSLTNTPPSVGGVGCLVTGSLPSELYGATSGASIAVIKSTDAGLNWVKSDSGLSGEAAYWLTAASAPACT